MAVWDVMIGSTWKPDTTEEPEPVWLRYEDRPLGVAIIGKTGTGKSSVLERMILTDLANGTAGVAIDPHGMLAQRVINLAPPEVADRIVLVESSRTAPFGLNLLACREAVDDDDDPVTWAASSVVQTIKKLYGQGESFQPRLETYLRLIAVTLIYSGRTLVDATRLLHDDQFRDACIRRVSDKIMQSKLRDRWAGYAKLRPSEQVVYAEPIVNRLEGLLAPTAMQYMLGSKRTTIPFDELLHGDLFIIVSLPSGGGLGEEWCDYIGSMFLCTLADRLFARPPIPKPSRVHIYLDEYQRFETETTAKFLTEGRKYNVGITLAHQTRGQIRDVRGSDAELQARNLIVLGVTRTDADVLAGELPVTQREEWMEQVEIEDGAEPVLLPTRSPVDHLFNSGGHRNQRVVNAARTLFIAADQSVPRSSLEKVYPMRVPRGNAQLNQLLVDVMDGANQSDSAFRDRLFAVLFTLSGGNTRRPPWEAQYADVLAPHYTVSAYYNASEKISHSKWPQHPLRIMETVTNELRLWLNAYLDHKAEFLADSPASCHGLDRVDANLLDSAVRFAKEAVACSSDDYAIRRLKHEIGVHRQRLWCLLTLCDGLSNDPILVPSGQERPRKRVQVIVHPRQSEQDARNELAASLVNPSEKYVAHVKVPTNYYEVQLLEPCTIHGAGCDIAEVRRRSQELYAMREDDFFQEDDDDEPPSIGRRPPKK